MVDIVEKPQPATGEQVTETVATKTNEQPTETVESLKAQLESANKRISDLNKESEKHRKKAEEFDAAKRAEEEAKLSETEKLKKQIESLNAEKEKSLQAANERLIKAHILSKADKFIDADAVYALIDKSKITVKDDGTIEGATEALAELEKSKPHLLKQNPVAKPGATNPGVNGSISETREQTKERLMGSNRSGIWEAQKE